MSSDALRAILTDVGIELQPGSPAFLSWLGTIGVPPELADLFRECVPRGQKRNFVRWQYLYSEEEIQSECEKQPRYMKAGLLAIGYCNNGDPIAVDVRKQVGSVGYISHDAVWEDEEARVRRFFIFIAPSLIEFARLARDGQLPIDYWEAKRKK